MRRLVGHHHLRAPEHALSDGTATPFEPYCVDSSHDLSRRGISDTYATAGAHSKPVVVSDAAGWPGRRRRWRRCGRPGLALRCRSRAEVANASSSALARWPWSLRRSRRGHPATADHGRTSRASRHRRRPPRASAAGTDRAPSRPVRSRDAPWQSAAAPRAGEHQASDHRGARGHAAEGDRARGRRRAAPASLSSKHQAAEDWTPTAAQPWQRIHARQQQSSHGHRTAAFASKERRGFVSLGSAPHCRDSTRQQRAPARLRLPRCGSAATFCSLLAARRPAADRPTQ